MKKLNFNRFLAIILTLAIFTQQPAFVVYSMDIGLTAYSDEQGEADIQSEDLNQYSPENDPDTNFNENLNFEASDGDGENPDETDDSIEDKLPESGIDGEEFDQTDDSVEDELSQNGDDESELNVDNEQKNTIDLSGLVIYMGSDGTEFEQPDLILYVNGVANREIIPDFESEAAEFPAWRYSFTGLPEKDGQGELYNYAVKTDTSSGDKVQLFYRMDGKIVGSGEASAQSQLDFVYVQLRSVTGEYRVEGEEGYLPEDVILSSDTLDADDVHFCPDNADISPENARWSLQKCPRYNPLTGNEIEYRVRIAENADDYQAEYQNSAPYKQERDYAFAAGVIVNRYTGESRQEEADGTPDITIQPASVQPFGVVPRNALSAEGSGSFAVRVNWNDNNNAQNDRPDSLSLILYYQTPDMAEPAELTADILEFWGVDPSGIGPSVDKTTEYNYWSYRYNLPEKLVIYDESSGDPVAESLLTYSFIIRDKAALEEYYGIEYGGDGKSVICTQKMTFSIDKIWKDSGNRYGTRPSQSEMSGKLTLFRSYTTQNLQTVSEEVGLLSNLGQVEINDSSDAWNIRITELPEYDAAGNLYIYYIKEKNDAIDIASGNTLDNAGSVKYAAAYDNVGNYTDRKTGCYDNGSIVNTLTDTVVFSGKKQWQDDGRQTRPDGKLYLYRYPQINGRDYTTASPVSGMELALDTSTNYYTIDFSGLPSYPSGGLPRFDDEGNEYVYFVQEITGGATAGNYTRFYDYGGEAPPDPDAANALFDGGVLQNRRTGTVSLPVTKTWKAAARQDMDASVTLLVERRLKGASNPFAPVNGIGSGGEYELSGFRAEVMELSYVFAGLPQFDTEGLEYEYRVTEKAVTINGGRMDLSAVSSVGDTKTCVTEDGYTFDMSETVSPDGSITLTNRLVGKTEVRVRKIWNGVSDTASLPPVTINIYRDGTHVATEMINPQDAWVQNSGDLNHGGQWLVSTYDRYDEEGREYRYTVVETGIAGYQTTYGTSRTQEEKDGVNIGVVTTTVTNTPAGEGKHVVITKQWYDDGDETCRGPVMVGLYHTDDGGQNWALVSTGTLSAGNDWTVWLALESDDQNYENYYVRELGVTRGVMYNVDTSGIGDYPALTADSVTPVKTGTLKTNGHFYDCYAYANTNKSSYTFRNVRTGTVDIYLEKEWIDSGYHIGQVNQEVTLEILRRLNYTALETTIQTVKLDGTVDSVETSGWKASFTGLPKYDEKGVLYLYRVAETQVKEISGSNAGDTHTVAGGYTLTDGHRYSAGISENMIYGEHVSGQTGPSSDRFTFKITNMRSDSVDFKVYKVWKDIIRTGETRSRPDIYLTLYKTISGVTTEVTPYVERVWTTTGSFNNYYWQCSFSSLPRYTANGEEIIYSVKEVMPFPGEYETGYYNASPVPVASPALAVIASGITVYDVPEGAQSGNGSVLNGGTIVNVRKAQRYLTGQKVWENVPVGISGDDLPSITLQLQIYEYDDVKSSFEYNNVIGYATVDLTSGKQNFVFNRQDGGGSASPYLPKYDEYGVFIIYRAAEVSGNTPGYLAPVYDDYNLAVKNVYDITSADKVKVTVTKVWANVPGGLDAALYPTAGVELWRCMVDESGADRIATAEKVDTKTIKYPNTGTIEFTGLTKYGYNGRPYRYYVKETLNGYSVTVSDDTDPTGLLDMTAGKYDKTAFKYEVTNTYTGISNQYIRLSGQKVWTDSNSAYDTRPAGISLKVWRATEGVDYSAVEITDSVDIVWTKTGNIWSYLVTAKQAGQVTDVGVYDASGSTLYRYAYNGSPYAYYVEEQSPNHHYTSTARTGTKVTEIRLAGLPGTSRPVSGGNIAVKSVADSAGNMTASFTNTLVTVECATEKTWLKEEASDSVPLLPSEFAMMLPDSVTFQVQYYDGSVWKAYPNDTSPVTRTLTREQCISAMGNSATITVTFSGLPEFGARASDIMQYRVIETAINGVSIYGVTGGYGVSDNSGVLIKNTLETIPLTIRKEWDDENNQDGVRPVAITFSIVRDGDTQSAILVTLADTEWSAGKTVYVPKYKADGVTESVYTVEELLTSGQKADYALTNVAPGVYILPDPGTTGSREFEFTNMHSAREINVTVEKSWSDAAIDTTIGSGNRIGIRPASVSVTLQRRDDSTGAWDTIPDSALAGGETATVILDASNNWKHTWAGLQSRHNSGEVNNTMKRYQFRVVEAPVTGYTAKYSLTNTFGTTVTVVDDQNCDANNNVKINIRNDLDITSLAVEKVWDNNGGEFAATAQVTVRLLYRKLGNPVWNEGTVTLTLTNPTWKGTFTNLPLKAIDGTAFEYSFKETMIGGDPVDADEPAFSYTNAVSGGKVTNTLATRSDITVIKVWDDAGDQDGIRTANVTVKLIKDKGTPEEKESAPVILNSSNSWSHTWTNLPKYRRDGSACVYTVEESTPTGYAVAYSLDGGEYQTACEDITENLSAQDMEIRIVRIKNSYTPKTVKLTVSKQWIDDNDRFGTRPDTLKIQLMFTTNPDGKTGAVAYGNIVTLDSSSWRHSWNNLPVMKDGRKIYYSVAELRADGSQNAIPIPGYPSTAFDYALTGGNGTVVIESGKEIAIAGDIRDPNGTEHAVTVTNALDTVELTVEKQWSDYNDLYSSRPDALVFTLQRMPEGGALYQNVVDNNGVVTKELLKTNSPQTVVFEGLPKYDANGAEYRYRAIETDYRTADGAAAVSPEPQNLETGTFSSGNFQYDFISSTQAVTDGYKTIVTNTLRVEQITLSGTKTWDDGQNKYLSRPNDLEIKLFYKKAADTGWIEFPAGSYSALWTRDETTGKWFYTISGLPRYVSGTTDAWDYSIVETLPEFYEQTEPVGVSNVIGTPDPTTGNISGADLTNTLETGAVLSVTKKKDRGPDSIEFEFTVYVSGREINTSNPGIIYKGGYKVFAHNDDVNTAYPIAAGYTADGKIKIKADQKFVLEALPPGYYYKLAETKHGEYVLDEAGSSNLSGQLDLSANTVVEAIAANLAITELAIENTTVNHDTGAGAGMTNAGGKVAIVDQSDSPDKYDMDGYKQDRQSVVWMPEPYWLFGDSYTIYYTEFGETQERILTVSNYLDCDGNLKPFNQCDFDDPTEAGRFIQAGASLSLTADGAVMLILAADVNDMPRKTRVEVQFIPTLSVSNTTDQHAGVGGTVMVDNGHEDTIADGVPDFGGTPYRAAWVVGLAETGYRVADSKIAIRNMSDLNGIPVILNIQPDGSFSALLTTTIAGNTAIVEVTGRVEYRKDNSGNITEVKVIFDDLPVPLQVDIEFERIPASNPGGGNGGGNRGNNGSGFIMRRPDSDGSANNPTSPESENPEPQADTSNVQDFGDPKTGDDTPVGAITILGFLTAIGAISLRKTKPDEEDGQ